MKDYGAKDKVRVNEGGYRFLRRGGWIYLCLVFTLAAVGAGLFINTMEIRYRLEVTRLMLEDRLDILESARWDASVSERMLQESELRTVPSHSQPYLVISIVDRRLWYKEGGTVLMTSRVATGSGKTLEKTDGATAWKFDTPRGRLKVTSKEENPMWVPPEWYYVEQARKRKLGLARLERGKPLAAADGSVIRVSGTDVVRVYPDGRQMIMQASDGHDIVVDGMLLVPPLGTNQRRFEGVLGSYRLNLGNGYGIHGTNMPESVGRAVSHGCVRMLNEDISKLYGMVQVGTPVYIY